MIDIVKKLCDVLFGWLRKKKPDLPPVIVVPQPDKPPANVQPIWIAHGERCHVPMADKSNRPRGREKIHKDVKPFNDFRTLEIGDDAFLDGFIMDAVRIVDGQMVGDDLARGDVVYVWDHWSPKTSAAFVDTNPLPLAGVSGSCRAWWRCHRAVQP